MIDRNVIEEIKKIDMVEFLESQGYSFKREGANFYRCIEHSSLILKDKSNIFTYYWNTQNEHGDIIDFVQKHICNDDFLKSISYLKAYIGLNKPIYNAKYNDNIGRQNSSVNDILKINLAENKKRAIAYLCQTRKLEYATVIEFIRKGLIAQDKRSNVVFLFKDEKSKNVGAEAIGTNTTIRYKGIIKNSNEEYGFSLKLGTKSKYLYVFESCIDLISYYEMFKLQLDDAVLLSINGACKINKINNYVNNETETIYMCTDNDEAGTKTIKNISIYTKIKVIDNRDALKAYNVKDFNELLKLKKCSLKET
ncbi:MAG: DUF3991 and TOPRIM domain-containing protein [Clostridium sp.]|uniref:DUF3991 and TOPRIM domain-containing protein n=1 Tax=Clostridium sp. TaxID=1506 RepID=UPI002A917CFF|nr:DUF3991 and TOPRIM domain-containing protein [Clostridium sp.]MDY6228043.1 DUF3991 and TOPRIM domain-containing protein [Clostridium sp.]